MTSLITEVFYLTRDNTVDLLIKQNGALVDLTDVTKVEVLDLDCSWSVNSDDTPSAFEIGDTDGLLVLKFGQQPIEAGTYTCQIVLYDPTNLEGVVWDVVKLVFKTSCPAPTP